MNSDAFIAQYQPRIENTLKIALQDTPSLQSSDLLQAIEYSVLRGGKRIRGLLTHASACAITAPNPFTDISAAAIECIHAYSLIHDDLPAMDNDDLRRGKPTCHIAFNEATAILAGDALQTIAFEWLSQAANNISPSLQLQVMQVLATASGPCGMVGGQSLDLAATNQQLSLQQLTQMHQLKTGALIKASVVIGALSTSNAQSIQIDALNQYAEAIGLAFQIQDDIIDVTSCTQTLGKTQGTDALHNKSTFVSLLGLEGAQAAAETHYQQSLDALSIFDERANPLRSLAAYIVKRNH